jgi:hypothetical protein
MKVLNSKHRRGKIISSCTATILLTFVKTIYISGNFIAIEKYNIVEWDEDVAEQINTFVSNGGTIITIDENKTKKQPITVYGETTQSGCIKICSESNAN